MVKTFDEEIIENCAVEEIEAEIQESDEIDSRIMDLLRLINEATTPKDNNAGISTVPTTNVSETTSSGSNASEIAPQSTTPSGSSGTSTLTFENALTFNYRGAQLMVEFSLLMPLQLLTLELCNHRIVLLQVMVLNHLLTLA